MKYALIAMVAIYLVTFGCNPKTEEEITTSQDKVEHEAIVEAPTAPAELTITPQIAVQTTPETTPANHNVAADKAPATPASVVVTTEQVDQEVKPATNEHNEADVKDTPQIEEKVTPAVEKAETAATNSDQWKNIAQSAANTVLMLMHQEQGTQPAQAEETAAATENSVTPATTTEAVTILPCGKKVSQDEAKQSPCAKHNQQVTQQPAVPAEETELSEAMQKMVNATNNMVAITRHLVIATQQMLAASKDVAIEVIDTGKDAIENSKPAVQNAVNEKEIIETVKEVMSATRAAYEATTEALSKAIESQEAQPAPEATPQQ